MRAENAQFALSGRLDAAAVGILLFKRSKKQVYSINDFLYCISQKNCEADLNDVSPYKAMNKIITDKLDEKNFYAFNPSFDKKCFKKQMKS